MNKGGNGGQKQRAQGQSGFHTDAGQLALVYVARLREDNNAAGIIAGTFTVNTIPYFDLINIRSTYSYVSCEMAGKLCIKVEDTVRNVTILSPLRQFVSVKKVYK